jgi:hypothetical protein
VVPPIVADAITQLHGVRNAVSLRSLYQYGRPVEHASLLTNTAARSPAKNPEQDLAVQFGPLSQVAIQSVLRDLGKCESLEIEGHCAIHRLRKTAARLVGLTIEGSTLVLRNVLHHDSWRTTLHYMFASPLMQQDLAEFWPEIAASNLRELYGRRDQLVGPGVANLQPGIRPWTGVAGAQAEPDLGVTEDEFVELGVDMMQKGHMLLTRLGAGVWCFKPALERGKCNEGSQDIIPNGGRCSVQCRFHIQDGRRTAANLRDLANIDEKLASPQLSRPIRALYQRYRAELVTIIPKEMISE